jgi:hypothetical protein
MCSKSHERRFYVGGDIQQYLLARAARDGNRRVDIDAGRDEHKRDLWIEPDQVSDASQAAALGEQPRLVARDSLSDRVGRLIGDLHAVLSLDEYADPSQERGYRDGLCSELRRMVLAVSR